MIADIEKLGRIAAFVDGYNLYETLRQRLFGTTVERAFWCRLDKIVACCLGIAADDAALNQLIAARRLFVNYYTAPPYHENRRRDPRYNAAHYRQWIRLQKNLGVAVEESYFKPLQRRCPKCHHVQSFFQEKLTDINLAVDIVCGAYENLYDTAVIVSRDRDINPAIKKIELMKNVFVVRAGETADIPRPEICNLSREDFAQHCLEADEIRFEDAAQSPITIIPAFRLEFDEKKSPYLKKCRTAKKLHPMRQT